MDERITVRLPGPLLKSIDAYGSATGKSRSDAIRFLLERGAKEVRTRYGWSEQRADLARLFRPVLSYFDSHAEILLDRFSKKIADELHIAMAGLQDDFARTQNQQGDLLEAIESLREQLHGSPIWSEELAATLAEVRGLTGGLMNHGAIQNQEAGRIAVRIATRVGQRLGVKGGIFQKG